MSFIGYLGKFPTCEEAALSAAAGKKFTIKANSSIQRATKERRRQLFKEEQQTNNNCEKPSKWSGWGHNESQVNEGQANGSTVDPSLALIMKAEEAKLSNVKTSSPLSNKPSTKRTRKQSWKSLSFEESPSSAVLLAAAPVTNPWKVLPQNDQADDVVAILKEESVQSENLSRAMSQPFHVTQMEEKAMSELKTFYNADNVFDESITVQRVQRAVLATPVWKRSNSNHTKKLY